MKITIKDIARIAGVSTATVSKIINKKDQNISQATRERILQIARENNYIPNTAARSLVTKQTKTLGLVIPDITNPFFPELARGAEDKASEEGYNIIFCNTDDNLKKEEKYIAMLMEKMVDGIIFTQSLKRTKGFDSLKNFSVPIVLIDRDMDIPGVMGKVLVDNLSGAYKGVSHLLEKGYRKIGFITGDLTTNTALERLHGYKKALDNYGIDFDENYVFEGTFRKEWGYEGIKKIFKEKIEIDSVFCGNDLIALGAIKALKEAGKSVPEDVAVLGFDDIYLASLVDPELTTIRQPNYDMGYRAVELLVNILDKREDNYQKVILKTELIVRKST